MAAGAGQLLQDPRALFFGESAPVTVEWRGLSVRVHNLCFTHVLVNSRYHVYVYERMNQDLSGATAEKAAKADILRCRRLLKFIALRIFTAKLQQHPQSDAHLGSRNVAGRIDDSSEACLECLKVQRLFKVRCCAQLLAVFLGLRARLAAHDNNRNRLCPAERGERLAQFITGILWHAQIEKDGVRPML